MRCELRRLTQRPQEPGIEPRFFDRLVAEFPSRHTSAEERIRIRPRPEENETTLAYRHCRKAWRDGTTHGWHDTRVTWASPSIISRMRAGFDRFIDQLAFILWLTIQSAIAYGEMIGLERDAAIMLWVVIMMLSFWAGWDLGNNLPSYR